MFRKPIAYFIIGLVLFLLFYGMLTGSLRLFKTAGNWILIGCLLVSQFFSWMAVIKGFKLSKKKEGSFILNLIAFVGSLLIILLFIYWAIMLTYLLYF
jgi:hypothetical protein